MTSLQQFEKEVSEGIQFSPQELADKRLQLSGFYARASDQIIEILNRKPDIWVELRKGTKSDTSAERQYELTEDGKKLTALRWEIKKIDKLSSAIKQKLEVLSGEARNMF